MSSYAATFRELQPNYDPRHIEAFVRLEYHTIGHLPLSTLKREAKIAAQCVDVAGVAESEEIARSFGL
jgi:hypothetical protein